jgi:hypothetical protein
MKILNYDTDEFRFRESVCKMLENDQPENLEIGKVNMAPGDSLYKSIGAAAIYQTLYKNLFGKVGKYFYEQYDNFIRQVIAPQFDEPIFYQARPTHRILFRDARGEARMHRDKDYGHHVNEVNFLVPQTLCYGNNSIWLENSVGDLEPVKMTVGEFLQFDGANRLHGAQVNDTGQTRVSFDFRIILKSDKEENTKAIYHKQRADVPKEVNPHNFLAV